MPNALPTRALSVRQPWAWLLATGAKPVENRTWRTSYRGPLYIHAGLRFDMHGYGWVVGRFPHLRLPDPYGPELACGGIVGRVDLVDCVTAHDSRWFVGPFGLVVANAEPVPFHPCRGRLGFFVPELGAP